MYCHLTSLSTVTEDYLCKYVKIWIIPISITIEGWIGFMVFNATFNNIRVIFWQSVLLVEEIGVPGENHRPVASHWQTLPHNVVSSTSCNKWGSNSTL
jgi:hypothetical protein